MPVYSNKNSIKNKKKQSVKNKVGITLIAVSSVLLINLIFNILTFINSLLLGTFGLFSYAIFISCIVFGILLIKNFEIKMETTDIILCCAWIFVFLLILHLATSLSYIDLSYGQYIASCYKSKLTCGGALISLFVYPVHFIFSHAVASFIILAIALIILTSILIVHLVSNKPIKSSLESNTVSEQSSTNLSEFDDTFSQPEYNFSNQTLSEFTTTSTDEDDDLIIPDEEADSYSNIEDNEDKIKARNILGLGGKVEIEESDVIEQNNPINGLHPTFDNTSIISDIDNKYSNNNKPKRFLHSEQTEVKPERKLTEKDKENLKYLQDITGGYFGKNVSKNNQVEDEVIVNNNQPIEDYDVMQDLYDESLTKNNYQNKFKQNNNFNNQNGYPKQNNYNNRNNNRNNYDNRNGYDNRNNDRKNNSFDNRDNRNSNFDSRNNFNNRNNNFDNRNNYNNNQNNFVDNQNHNNNFNNGYSENKNNYNNNFNNNFNQTTQNGIKLESEPVEYKQVQFAEVETRKPTTKKLYKRPTKYVKPPIELLKIVDNSKISNTEDNSEKARILEEVLQSFNIPAKVVSITKGPAFTRFELQMQQGVSVKKVTGHIEDIAMALEARGDVRMEIPIPGKNAFGVEVPNESIATVGLRDILESYNFQGNKSPLTFGLGKDISGDCKVARVDKMPHMLVAGATGSGKSVCLNALLISLIYKASPSDVRLILVDPKRVEFTLYNGLPHLLLPKVITDIDKALSALSWLIDEMERRFNLFSEARVRQLDEYNSTEEVINGSKEKLPYIVFIIDELGDLMLQNKKEVEEKIIRITQKSRAAGIHLIIATQRPSVDVITGTIKANLPSRIAFAVSSFPDSKTILDQGGAEKLLGRGDMLYSPVDMPDPVRIQGAFVSNEEVEAVVEFVKENNEADFDSDIEDQMFNKKQGGFNAGGPSSAQEFDPLMKDACRLVIKTGGVSTSKLQRAFGLGFPRAGKIVDQMEAAGFISAPDSKKIRTVFITQQEFEERFGEDL